MPQTVAPGATLRLCAELVTPAAPGRYTIEWDLVREGVHWFSELDRTSVARRSIRVACPAATPKSRVEFLRTFVWVLATLGHLVAVVAISRHLWPRASADELFFGAALLGVGGLLAVVAVVASTVGLDVGRASLLLAAADSAAVILMRRVPHREVTHHDPARRLTWAEWAGAWLICAVAVHRAGIAVASTRVDGTDVAHYHVPHAVNFALGASPWGLTATPHLYPMGTSLLTAWFVLPLGSPLLVDLTLLPIFLLLTASLGWIFRLATRQLGLA